jgi:DNA invertase Pin-like site-specific DNA recombinase
MIKKQSQSRTGKYKLSNSQINEINELLKMNKSVKEIASKYKISLSTVYKIKSNYYL